MYLTLQLIRQQPVHLLHALHYTAQDDTTEHSVHHSTVQYLTTVKNVGDQLNLLLKYN